MKIRFNIEEGLIMNLILTEWSMEDVSDSLPQQRGWRFDDCGIFSAKGMNLSLNSKD